MEGKRVFKTGGGGGREQTKEGITVTVGGADRLVTRGMSLTGLLRPSCYNLLQLSFPLHSLVSHLSSLVARRSATEPV